MSREAPPSRPKPASAGRCRERQTCAAETSSPTPREAENPKGGPPPQTGDASSRHPTNLQANRRPANPSSANACASTGRETPKPGLHGPAPAPAADRGRAPTPSRLQTARGEIDRPTASTTRGPKTPTPAPWEPAHTREPTAVRPPGAADPPPSRRHTSRANTIYLHRRETPDLAPPDPRPSLPGAHRYPAPRLVTPAPYPSPPYTSVAPRTRRS
jgi:hypothetical protein